MKPSPSKYPQWEAASGIGGRFSLEKLREFVEICRKRMPKAEPHYYFLSNKSYNHYIKKIDEGMSHQDALISALTEA